MNVLYVPRFQKLVKKRGNRSEFHSERNYYLQNWYFSQTSDENTFRKKEKLKKAVKFKSSEIYGDVH